MTTRVPGIAARLRQRRQLFTISRVDATEVVATVGLGRAVGFQTRPEGSVRAIADHGLGRERFAAERKENGEAVGRSYR